MKSQDMGCNKDQHDLSFELNVYWRYKDEKHIDQ